MSGHPFTGVYTGANYAPYYFTAAEFGSEKAFETYGNRLLRYIDSRIKFTVDQLRHHFGVATINSWSWGGNRQYSGLRLPGEPYYKQSSDHSYGQAADVVFKDITAKEVRDFIEANPDKFPFITFIEEGESVDWLHISVSCVRETFGLKKLNSIVFWSLDTGQFRVIERSKAFSLVPFLQGAE